MGAATREVQVGNRYGLWTVIAALPSRKSGTQLRRVWLCRCECGTERSVPDFGLRKGHSKSCGCLQGKVDIVPGTQFGFLKVIGPAGSKRVKYGLQRLWLCLCDCGNTTVVNTGNLRSGNTRSCGCLGEKNARKHGEAVKGNWTTEYNIWAGIVQRTSNPKCAAFGRYGGRGIRLYEPWRKSFIAFRDYVVTVLGRRPGRGYSIDRKDNEGHYEPGNLRWATAREQANNRRQARTVRRVSEQPL